MILASRALAILYSFLEYNCNKTAPFILPVNICHTVHWCFIKAGIPVIFCDLEPTHLCIDLEKAENILRHTPCQGLLFNHTYGTDYYPEEKLHKIRASKGKLFIIDDRCLCVPNFNHLSFHAAIADLTIFSTGYAKHVDLGYGGIGFVSDRVSWEKIVFLPYCKEDEAWLEKRRKDKLPIAKEDIQTKRWLHSSDDFEKNTYLEKIAETLPGTNQHKQQLNEIYREQLDPRISKLPEEFNSWRYNLWVSKQKELLQVIFTNGLFASAHYEINSALHQDFPVASHLAAGIVNLFNDKYFTVEKAQKCVQVINEFFASNQ